MLEVRGGEVVEGQQRGAILDRGAVPDRGMEADRSIDSSPQQREPQIEIELEL